MHLWADLKDYIIRYNAKDWSSKVPNIDIRHGGNWTGQRRGKQRTWELPFWGSFQTILENNNGYQRSIYRGVPALTA